MKDTPDFYQRQAELRQLLVSKHKPFGWMVMKHSFDMELTHNLQIGMVGDYVHSAKYKEDKNRSFLTLIQPVLLTHCRWGEELFRRCEGMVKQRTCHTNYAPLWSVLEFQYNSFRYSGLKVAFSAIVQGTV